MILIENILVYLFLIPFTNTSEVRSTTFRPIFKICYWLLVADFLILGWVSQKPVKDIYVLVGQVATVYYFLFFMLLTPLEQFEIISLLPINLFSLDFSVTNLLLINIVTLIFFSSIVHFFSVDINYAGHSSFYLVPSTWQVFIETIYDTVFQLLFNNIKLEGEKYFPFISVIFVFILFGNLIGLIFYSFTVTSHVIITFALGFIFLFTGKNILGAAETNFSSTGSNETVIIQILTSKFGGSYFPFIWYETLITRSIPRMLGVTAGFQAVVFNRYHGFLIVIFFVLLVVYLSLLITVIFHTDKKLYHKLDTFFLQNEVIFQNFSYWKIFKKLYLDTDVPATKKSSTKHGAISGRNYSTTSLTAGLMWSTSKGIVAKQLGAWGAKLAPTAVPKAAAPVAAKSSITIGSQGLSAAGSGVITGLGVGGGLIITGGDQVIRYGIENGINTAVQPGHKWTKFEMQSPADVWIHGSKK